MPEELSDTDRDAVARIMEALDQSPPMSWITQVMSSGCHSCSCSLPVNQSASAADTTLTPTQVAVGVEFEGMTWRDLRHFVSLCAAIPEDEEVGQYFGDDGAQAGFQEYHSTHVG